MYCILNRKIVSRTLDLFFEGFGMPWKLEKLCFTKVKHYFSNFQGIPNLQNNRSRVLLTIFLLKMQYIYNNVLKLGPSRDPKIHKKS